MKGVTISPLSHRWT